MIIIILYIFTSCLTTCVLFHQYPALIIVHDACSLLYNTYISLLAPACLCSRHDFQFMFINQIYWYTCACPCTAFDIRITTRWGVLTPLDPHVQILEFRACRFFRLLIRVAQLKNGSSADRLEPHPFRPCNAPILTDTDTSLQRIYVGQNCPHVYTLSIKVQYRLRV